MIPLLDNHPYIHYAGNKNPIFFSPPIVLIWFARASSVTAHTKRPLLSVSFTHMVSFCSLNMPSSHSTLSPHTSLCLEYFSPCFPVIPSHYSIHGPDVTFLERSLLSTLSKEDQPILITLYSILLLHGLYSINLYLRWSYLLMLINKFYMFALFFSNWM